MRWGLPVFSHKYLGLGDIFNLLDLIMFWLHSLIFKECDCKILRVKPSLVLHDVQQERSIFDWTSAFTLHLAVGLVFQMLQVFSTFRIERGEGWNTGGFITL
jgi:hypothetical protein